MMAMHKNFVWSLITLVTVSGAYAASVSILPGYPQGNAYVFVCNNDFGASDYNWFFGDGEKLLGIQNSDVYRRYATDGNYAVTCEADQYVGQGNVTGNATGNTTGNMSNSTNTTRNVSLNMTDENETVNETGMPENETGEIENVSDIGNVSLNTTGNTTNGTR